MCLNCYMFCATCYVKHMLHAMCYVNDTHNDIHGKVYMERDTRVRKFNLGSRKRNERDSSKFKCFLVGGRDSTRETRR